MRKSYIRKLFFIVQVLFLSMFFISCSTTKKIKYFQDIPDTGQLKTIPKAAYTEPTIQENDILNVTIQTIDPLATSVVNSANLSSSSTPSSGGASGILAAMAGGNSQPQTNSGYLVDKDGNIQMPIIGKVKVAGYTTSQIKDTVQQLAVKYFKDPTVVVSLINFKIDITGEVLKPGQYIMPSEKATIIDALAMAGDLTVFGKRENVLLIRTNLDGTKTPYRVNLKKSDVMYAPYYYLRQNDMIYVEPRKAKSDATDASQAKYITIAGAVLSLLIVIASRHY